MTNVLCESPTTERRRFSTEVARSVAQDFIDVLSDYCERIQIAGSLRRRKPFLKDVEIIFIPKLRAPRFEDKILRTDLFSEPPAINLAERAIANLLEAGLITKRPNVNGVTAWGAKNKLAIHVPSGMPVDLFTATPANFFNYLVCRTGGEQNNIAIASAAQARGWKWNPYGEGFSRPKGLAIEVHPISSEREVFDFVGLPYLEPWRRT
jgi:DNA polymerase/3'-5' exonuclease PolX